MMQGHKSRTGADPDNVTNRCLIFFSGKIKIIIVHGGELQKTFLTTNIIKNSRERGKGGGNGVVYP